MLYGALPLYPFAEQRGARGAKSQAVRLEMGEERGSGENEKDLLVKDNKKLAHSGCSVLTPFLALLLLGVPLWLGLMLPLTLLWKLLALPCKLCTRPPKPNTPPEPAAPAERPAEQLDIVLFGATGFTGNLAARYVAKTYGTSVKWAIAGRRRSALEMLRAELAETVPGLSTALRIIVCDSNDTAQLAALVAQTKVVLTTVGPFARYGSPLVAACAAAGTHYCDITGESDWVREMVDRHDDTCRRTGARVVHFCGHDCVPWDIAVQACAQKVAEKGKGERLSAVRCYDDMRGSASGGTMATVFESLQDRAKYRASACRDASGKSFDPLLREAAPGSGRSGCATKANNQSCCGYSDEGKAWVGPFVMAMVMANCIRRSNALLGYGPKLKYYEAARYPSFPAAFVSVFGLVLFGTCLACPPLAWLLRTCVLPSPGQGPSEATMNAGFLRVTVCAEGEHGTSAKCSFYFPTDPVRALTHACAPTNPPPVI
jgi:short subunit dehydrogenase-like uncharacterized protein